jgi:hypothetical protein
MIAKLHVMFQAWKKHIKLQNMAVRDARALNIELTSRYEMRQYPLDQNFQFQLPSQSTPN